MKSFLLFIDHVLLEADKSPAVGLEKDSADTELDAYFLDAEETSTDDIFEAEIFAGELVRLIKNFDNLVDTKHIILTRALKYVEKNISIDAKNDVITALDEYYRIDLNDMPDILQRKPLMPGAFGSESAGKGI